jgi:hypothetical protein
VKVVVFGAKLQEILHAEFFNYSDIQQQFAGSRACFFCLGVSSVGMAEETYRHLTYDLTWAAAHSMLAVNDQLTFCYVSGAGTDTTERGRMMSLGPLYPILSRVAPRYVTTTEALGQAMIRAVVNGYPKPILETEDINRLAVTA